MKTNLKRAVNWKVKKEGKKRFIQLFDEYGNELDGENAYWEGDFDCSDNQLETLEGSPVSIKGSFYCDDNQLISLKGSPVSVEGSFFCNNNKLITLKGSPVSVGGDFDCSDNRLETLEGSPVSVEGSFFCGYNELTTLERVQNSKLNLSIMILLFSVLFISCAREDHSKQRAAQLEGILRGLKASQAGLNKDENEMIILYKGKIELILHENTTSEIYDPCGDGPGPDEVILKIISGDSVTYFRRINNEFFSLMTDGTYQTRDQDACTFNIENGRI